MRISSIDFTLGEKKISLNDKYADSDNLIKKTGIPQVWETSGNILNLGKIAAEKILDDKIALDINILILVTQSPADFLPANSSTLANMLNLKKTIFTFDFNQGCSGFVQSFIVMSQLIKKFKKGLLITADCYRAKLDPSDRSTNAVFSDGAAAMIVDNDKNLQILFEDTLTDGSKRDLLFHSNNSENDGYLYMSGPEIWMFTRIKVIPQIKSAINYCEDNKLSISSIYIHQASKLVVDGIKESLGSYSTLVLENYMLYGNTVSSTIPILIANHPINQKNGVVIFAGFGVGLTSSVIVYGESN
tara:strand:- start:1523 stop:2428 length:906 start_codon:yes stop_codon:yes gene_type:complete